MCVSRARASEAKRQYSAIAHMHGQVYYYNVRARDEFKAMRAQVDAATT